MAPPPDADAAGCRWPATVEFPIGDDWRSGFHLVTLTAHGAPAGRDVAHACFVVRSRPEDSARPRALFVLDTNTWHAYNTWGGRSLYTGGQTVSHARPFGRGMLCRPEVERDDRKARPVRWGEEPDVDGTIFQAYRTEHDYPAAIGSTGWFTHARRFVEWAERSGYRFDYAVSSDLELRPRCARRLRHGDQRRPRRVLVAPASDDAVEEHVRRGGNFVSFSGNTMFWQVRLEGIGDDDGGVSGVAMSMVCHKYAAHLDDPVVADGRPGEMTGMWADPLVGRPEWELLGAGSAFGLYHRFGRATPAASAASSSTATTTGCWRARASATATCSAPTTAWSATRRRAARSPSTSSSSRLLGRIPALPADIEIVAFTPSSNLGVGEYPASISALSDQGDLEFIATRLFGEPATRTSPGSATATPSCSLADRSDPTAVRSSRSARPTGSSASPRTPPSPR